FGGLKQSGTARTHGKQDVLQFTQVQAYGVGGVPFFLDVAARLREPNNHNLMRAIFHALFGVTLRQRLRAVPDAAAHVASRLRPAEEGEVRDGKPVRQLALGGMVAGLAALLVTVLRDRH
ncbi:MAG TPA: hypothetical protein VE553_10050, partial [Candidatus Binatia bacterium]|nr:hypothetical protein [Candidatus Binatia bacterium]